MNTGFYSSYLEVDLGALRGNIEKTLRHIGNKCGMIPVIKANCYAMGLERIAALLTDEFRFDTLAVAQVYEGIRLRRAGFAGQVLVMGSAPAPAVDIAVESDLQLTAFLPSALSAMDSAAAKCGKTARVHIKLETGMNRLGVHIGDELDQLISHIKTLKHTEIIGVFTHFSTASERGSAYTLRQYDLFKRGVAQLRSAGIDPEYVHCCNSGATIWLTEAFDFCTHIRPGSLYMGYDVMEDGSNPLGVREPMSWRAFITNIHEVPPGEGAGYSQHFRPDRPTAVGTVSIGYADGLFRPMVQNGGPVLVNDTRSRYLACMMDQCLVDVTGIDCKVGDEITVVGHSAGGSFISAFEIERLTGQCYQNALTSINDRVLRIYKD